MLCMLEEIIGIVVALTIVVSETNVRDHSTSGVQQASLPSPANCDSRYLQRTLEVGRVSENDEYM